MNSEPRCGCLLCRVDKQLRAELASSIAVYDLLCHTTTNGLRSFSSPFHLLAYLKHSPPGPFSDDLFRELLLAHDIAPHYIETLMIVAFVPLLHGTVRRIAKQQTCVTRADITQQALTTFLEVLRSDQLRKRQSYFAFAISRSLKRQLFAWAGHEGLSRRVPEGLAPSGLLEDATLERHASLRHFLSRCVSSGLLNGDELDLLVQIKLDGATGEEIAESNAISPNAVRQRTKRLLAKLRRLAMIHPPPTREKQRSARHISHGTC